MLRHFIRTKINVTIEPCEDGGIQVWSDDLPGLILSGSDQEAILKALGPAIIELTLAHYRAARQAAREADIPQ